MRLKQISTSVCWASSWDSVSYHLVATLNAQISLVGVRTVQSNSSLLTHYAKAVWMQIKIRLSRGAKGLDKQWDFTNIHTSCVQAAKALARLRLYIYLHTLYVSSEGSAETVHLHMIIWALSARICVKYQSRQHCLCWFCWASSWEFVTFNIFATAHAQIILCFCRVPLKLLLLAHHTRYECR